MSQEAVDREFLAGVVDLFKPFPQVRAIALGGSRASGLYDANSDFDLEVYTDGQVPLADRKAIAAAQAGYAEVGNQTWGDSDEWITHDDRHLDFAYFDATWMAEQLDRVLVRYEGSVGYSTCFWHTIRVSQPLYDRDGWLAALQELAQSPYPEELRRDIIRKNYPILGQPLGSYRYQLQRAVERRDAISTNHRTAALLASVFDILFAVNRLTHPGEKRLADYIRTCWQLVPPGFLDQLAALLKAAGTADPALLPTLDEMLAGLSALLKAEGLIA